MPMISDSVVVSDVAKCHVTVGRPPCHLRPSDKQRLAAIEAAKQAALEQRALNERLKLLTVSYPLPSVYFVFLIQSEQSVEQFTRYCSPS